VVRLVAVAQALEDLDGVREGRLAHLDRLEAALERGVLLQVLAVLVERRRTMVCSSPRASIGLSSTRRRSRPRPHRAPTRRVQLVDEQDDVAAGADLLQHLLQALLEVRGSGCGDERAEVEGESWPCLLSVSGTSPLMIACGEPLDDRGLADTGLADEDGVVLRAARQHLP